MFNFVKETQGAFLFVDGSWVFGGWYGFSGVGILIVESVAFRGVYCCVVKAMLLGAANVLLADDLDEDSFAASAIKFVVEDVFPRAEVQLAVGDRYDDLAAHDLSFVVSVGVVFSGSIVQVPALLWIRACVEGHQFLEPTLVVRVQARFVVVDEHACCDVHRVD